MLFESQKFPPLYKPRSRWAQYRPHKSFKIYPNEPANKNLYLPNILAPSNFNHPPPPKNDVRDRNPLLELRLPRQIRPLLLPPSRWYRSSLPLRPRVWAVPRAQVPLRRPACLQEMLRPARPSLRQQRRLELRSRVPGRTHSGIIEGQSSGTG